MTARNVYWRLCRGGFPQINPFHLQDNVSRGNDHPSTQWKLREAEEPAQGHPARSARAGFEPAALNHVGGALYRAQKPGHRIPGFWLGQLGSWTPRHQRGVRREGRGRGKGWTGSGLLTGHQPPAQEPLVDELVSPSQHSDVGAIQSPLHKRGTLRSKVTQPEHESSRKLHAGPAHHAWAGASSMAPLSMSPRARPPPAVFSWLPATLHRVKRRPLAQHRGTKFHQQAQNY